MTANQSAEFPDTESDLAVESLCRDVEDNSSSPGSSPRRGGPRDDEAIGYDRNPTVHFLDDLDYISEDSVTTFGERPCGHQFVIHDSNPFRRIWSLILAILLLYTGTIFPYRLCFVEFRIPSAETEKPIGWQVWEILVDVLFWIDLAVNFFFTYFDHLNREVDRLDLIVKKYMSGYFYLNLVACLPEDVVAPLVKVIFPSDQTEDSNLNQVTRLARLQRTTRLARLSRLIRLARMVKFLNVVGNTPFWRYLQSFSGMQIVNFIVSLFFFMHILACGWYLCAALHEEYEETWVNRRTVSQEGETLLARGSFEQWLHAMYFVFSIFTTVGFGDMSAVTVGEICYCIFVMLVGAVIHSMFVSQVINILNKIDDAEDHLRKQKDTLEGFAKHALLSKGATEKLKFILAEQVHFGNVGRRFDKDKMRHLITNGLLPSDIVQELPQRIFAGCLQQNRFFTCCFSHAAIVPARGVILLSLDLLPRQFEAKEVVYQLHDHPYNIFLVTHGVFAYVAKPTATGGLDEAPSALSFASNFLAQGTDRARRMSVEAMKGKFSDVAARTVSSSSAAAKASKPQSSNTDDASRSSSAKLYSSGSSSGKDKTDLLQPYRLFVGGKKGAYFGDLELFIPTHRLCTARCEKKGQLLVLHKHDLWHFIEEFPQFRKTWEHHAILRVAQRARALSTLIRGFDYEELAVTTLQRWYREHLSHGPRRRKAAIFRERSHTKETRKAGKERRNSLDHEDILGAQQSSMAGHHQAGGVSDIHFEFHQELRCGLRNLRKEWNDCCRAVLPSYGELRRSRTTPNLANATGMERSERRDRHCKTTRLPEATSRLTEDCKTIRLPEAISRPTEASECVDNERLKTLLTSQRKELDAMRDIIMNGCVDRVSLREKVKTLPSIERLQCSVLQEETEKSKMH